MKIILAPAKKMNAANDDFTAKSMPQYIDATKQLLAKIQDMTLEEMKNMWKCSDRLAAQNEQRFRNMSLYSGISPAVFTYEGLAYQHLAAGAMDDSELAYLQEHLRILSGFYGILRPFDGVVPYRLEMQAVFPDGTDLYTFWNDQLVKALDDHLIINLASKEYSDAVRPYLGEVDRMIDIVFGEKKKDKIITKGTYAKMARGNMVWFMANEKIEDPEAIKRFNEGFYYSDEDSDENTWVFLRKDAE